MSSTMFFNILFPLSGLSIIALFVSKKFEKNYLAKFDSKSEKFITDFEFRLKQIIQTTKYILLVVIPRRSEESLKKGKDVAMREFNKHKDVVLGKKELKDGGASFFLKKMKEEMKNKETGEIQDDAIGEWRD
jgi:hypothetical protein